MFHVQFDRPIQGSSNLKVVSNPLAITAESKRCRGGNNFDATAVRDLFCLQSAKQLTSAHIDPADVSFYMLKLWAYISHVSAFVNVGEEVIILKRSEPLKNVSITNVKSERMCIEFENQPFEVSPHEYTPAADSYDDAADFVRIMSFY